MGIEKIAQIVGTKGLSGYKNMGKIMDDVEGYVLKAMNRAGKSKYCLGTTERYSGYEQLFKAKDGTIIKKVYLPMGEQGQIHTAVFKGDKAKIVEKNPYYARITQPDKLINQSWVAAKDFPVVTRHELMVTTPTEEISRFGIERGCHVKQQSKSITLWSKSAEYHEYPSKIDGGEWDSAPFFPIRI